jgi:hypothetical protein
MSERGGGCFRRSCFGCFAVVGLFFVGVILLAGVSFFQGGGTEVRERQQVEHSLPDPISFIPSGDQLASEPIPIELPEGESGRIVLDVSMTKFNIIPAASGAPLRLEADYDSNAFRLEESFQTNGERGWSYELTFDSRRTFNFFFNDEGNNELTLYLPVDIPIVLEGNVGIGASHMRFGGLWIHEIDLDIGIGEHRIDFDEPLRQPMQRLILDASIGEVRVSRIGNASPRTVEVDHSIGEIFVDLDGAWKNDSNITVQSSIGQCTIGMPPEDIRLDVRNVSTTIGESATAAASRRDVAPEAAPTVSLTVSHSIGEVRFVR